MRIGTAIPAGLGLQAYGISMCHKLFDAYLETVKSRLVSNYGEFAIIKIRVVDLLPNAKKFNGIPIPEPIRDEEVAILCFQHIGQGNIILIINRGHGDLRAIDHELVVHWRTSLTSCMKASLVFPMDKTKKHIVQRNYK